MSANSQRQALRQARGAMTQAQQLVVQQALWPRIKQQDFFIQSQKIAFYFAFDGEMDPYTCLQQSSKINKGCYLPVLDPNVPDNLCFLPYAPGDTLVKNRYNIDEPVYQSDLILNTKELDLVFVPLVGFDTKGNRLGMGAGFYDRTFNFKLSEKINTPLLIGLAYECQKLDNLTPNSWDVPLDYIITEDTIYDCKK